MPIPTPNTGETQKDFISRCMGDEIMVKDYPDEKQRSAICYKQWAEKDLGKGEKYYDEAPSVISYKPFGGAQSFEEVEEWQSAQDKRWEIEKVTYTAQDLMHNVMNDDDVMDKPNKLQRIVDGLRTRLMRAMGKSKKEGGYIKKEEIAILPPEEIIPAEKQATKTEGGVLYRASDYAVVPDVNKPSGWKLRLAESKSGDFTVQQIARAITAMQPSGFRGNKVELEPGEKKTAIQRINGAISKCDGDEGQKENLRKRLNRVKSYERGSFHITKKDGVMRWIGFPSNKWRDRDNPPQIIEEAAHKEFVEHLEKTGEYPVLLGWHTPGTKLGKADFAEYIDGFLVMGGTIDEDKYKEAENLAELSLKEKIGMSHGFVYKYSDEENEVIGWYRTWEVSHLPLSKAANLWTAIDILQKEVKEMPLTDERRTYLNSVYGQDTIDKVLAQIDDTGKSLASMGVEFKEVLSEDQLLIEVDQDEVVSKAVKAIVENESFKEMVASVGSLADAVKELTDTTIPELQKQIEEAKGTAAQAEEKAQKSVDDIIADAFNPRSKGYRPSVSGEPPTEKDKEQEKATETNSPVDPTMRRGFLGEFADVS